MRLLDLFSGRWGWSRAFAARGWECVGVDLVRPTETPDMCRFIQEDVLMLELMGPAWINQFDFICVSSPCEQFSVHGMPHFWPNPCYPELGIKLFNHARALCEASGLPYVMENVRSAQKFVGRAAHHCGPFFLWGSGVPPLMPQGIQKGMSQQRDRNGRRRGVLEHVSKRERAAQGATIPPELANCVADYAERLLEQKARARSNEAVCHD